MVDADLAPLRGAVDGLGEKSGAPESRIAQISTPYAASRQGHRDLPWKFESVTRVHARSFAIAFVPQISR